MAIIEISNLECRFHPETAVLRGIDLSIEAGEFVVIAGANGSGKTTLLHHLNALLLPTAGRVRVEGVPTDSDPLRARRMVGMVFQHPDSQIVGETVADDVAFGPENLRYAPEEIAGKVAAVLAAVGLTGKENRRPHTLSGGEKRRLAIAGVLAMDPTIIVFDEPFDSLDYPGIRQVLDQIVRLHRQGHTVIVTTHDVEKVIAHADRLVVLEKGRVVRDGKPEAVLGSLESFNVREPCAFRFGEAVPSWLN